MRLLPLRLLLGLPLLPAQGEQPRPNLAVAGEVSASTVQGGHDAHFAVDGDPATRWCASDGDFPQWWQVDLGAEHPLTGVEIDWEQKNAAYRYQVEVSTDGKTFSPVLDQSANRDHPGAARHAFSARARHLRVQVLGSSGGWASLWEIRVWGTPGAAQPASRHAPRKTSAADLVRDIKVAPGFQATVFATPEQANYPVFVAASVDGTVYVSSDGNGSLGRDPDRGRVLRLRDLDKDGKADEVKAFVPNLDSPRGLVWDHDRLYVLHPPHLSVFPDVDGNGEADGQHILVKNLAFTFKDRPADHTTNGLELGVDGWLYIAVGDFGFLEAEGADGRKLQMRGGGVCRVRPDGIGLEIFSYGTRNNLEVALSPLLDGFTRDNNNDGGGWDVRFHHFTGLEDHGYPKLYMHFGDEIVAPLADYGGGSGCGAGWIDEPGVPAEWNNLPYTSDWGRGPIFRHTVRPKGATFEETAPPTALCTVPRSTDLDVDGLSRIYVSSWKGGQFRWAGPEIGFIARVTPEGYSPPPVPDFARLSPSDLLEVLRGDSHRRRREAQRALIRGLVAREAAFTAAGAAGLRALAADATAPLASRVAALFALKQAFGAESHADLARLAADPSLAAWAIRALTDHEGQLVGVPVAPLRAGLDSPDARVRKESVIAFARLGDAAHATWLTPRLADADPIVAHTAFQALARLRAHAALLAALDQPDPPTGLREGAVRALQRLHDPAVVDGLIARLEREPAPDRRRGLITALCRLHFVEGTWTGTSWGTRPDTRGPYYQPEEWGESAKIAAALTAALERADGAEAAFISQEMARHRMKPGQALGRLLALAESDPAVRPALARQLAQADLLPTAAIPLLLQMAEDAGQPTVLRAQALQALLRGDDATILDCALRVLPSLAASQKDGAEVEKARNAFLGSKKLENHHQRLEAAAEQAPDAQAEYATAALLKLSAAKGGSPEARQEAERVLTRLWSTSAGKRRVLRAAQSAQDSSRAAWFVAALQDAEPEVVQLAEQTVKALRIEAKKFAAAASGPRIETLPVAEVIRQAAERKGDARRGELLFTQQGCQACHTVKPEEPLKGPYLGTIATTYSRRDLAEHILEPNKTQAQGFVTNVFTLKDGSVRMGFVTLEAADQIVIRDMAAQESALRPAEVVQREKLDQSLMPAGLVNTLTVDDFASLLDYLQELAQAQSK
jgi:putative heme-binding domain-containing protein